MEVHPHTHTARKKWTHYLWEFLMLFLAVFCGFLAENIREHLVNKKTEKQSIESLVKCLASDTTQLQHMIKANKKIVSHLDSFVKMRSADFNVAQNKRNFLTYAVVGFCEDWYFNTNDAALQQLKSSGTLRLIHKQNIVDSIYKYELLNKTIVAQQSDSYRLFLDGFDDFKKAVDLFFFNDSSIMKYSFGYDNTDVQFKNIEAISINKEKVNILYGDAATMAGPQIFYIKLMQDQLAYGESLIAFLKEEYHLENE